MGPLGLIGTPVIFLIALGIEKLTKKIQKKKVIFLYLLVGEAVGVNHVAAGIPWTSRSIAVINRIKMISPPALNHQNLPYLNK